LPIMARAFAKHNEIERQRVYNVQFFAGLARSSMEVVSVLGIKAATPEAQVSGAAAALFRILQQRSTRRVADENVDARNHGLWEIRVHHGPRLRRRRSMMCSLRMLVVTRNG